MHVIEDVTRLLLGLATPAALVALVLAGIALRREGTIAFGPGGGFGRWMLWAAVLLTLPGLLAWLSLWGIPVPLVSGSPDLRFLFNVHIDVMTFVNLWVIERLAPVLAAYFVLRAALDSAEGGTPLRSLLAAMFLLAVPATKALLAGWNTGTNYATVDVLAEAWTYLTARVMPVVAGLALCAAILNFASGRPALRLVGCAAGFLILPAAWRLVLRMM